ncbi:thiamine phosphate synthase [Acetobacter indonesiensis]|uniref:Thiamine phosphate pyrophosphorylase n=1 Tax=Acetobacter indonesiensis TaxID=104101 RepID=A0A252ATN8_9PROT|nr:thiamine phosphate synthase [Acetobacter indonesiensis]OUI93447.1 thiamine phosphate pyrophosphorylase [Acetobacter indonesiensis]
MTACDVYLATPVLRDVEAFLPVLARGLSAQPPSAVLLRLADAPEAALTAQIQKIQPLVQGQDIALILEDRPALALKTGCDGVHLSPNFTGSARDVRKQYGDALQLGVAVGSSRDAAMRAGEDGADYVCFGANGPAADPLEDDEPESLTALVQWWCMMMELPAVADVPDPAHLPEFVQAGADFIMPAESFWAAPQAWHITA